MMNRENLLDEIWREYIKDEIITCPIMKKEKTLQAECVDCDYYFICRQMFRIEEGFDLKE